LALFIAGCGVYEGSFTRELLEVLDVADVVYVDLYTMPESSWVLTALERWRNKIRVASRELLEGMSKAVVDEAMGRNVVIVSAGDPLVATTHVSLLAEAQGRGVEVRYIPGVSGVCAAKAYSGLSYYRFGRMATVPGPWRGLKPYSVLATIYANLCIDAHTLLLLDVSEDGLQLSPTDAALKLLEVEAELSETLRTRALLSLTPVIVVERAGTPGARLIAFESVESLSKAEERFRTPSSLVIPAPLNPTERWVLESRLNRALGAIWSRRAYERSECCEYYERTLRWLSEG